jgi:hypothetical protein
VRVTTNYKGEIVMEINNQIVEIPESPFGYVLIVHRKGFRRTRGAWPFGLLSATKKTERRNHSD